MKQRNYSKPEYLNDLPDNVYEIQEESYYWNATNNRLMLF